MFVSLNFVHLSNVSKLQVSVVIHKLIYDKRLLKFTHNIC